MPVVTRNRLAIPHIIAGIAGVFDTIAVAVRSKTLGLGITLDAIRSRRANPFHATAASVLVVGGKLHNLDAFASHGHNQRPTSNAGFIAKDADQNVTNLGTIHNNRLVFQSRREDRVHV